MSTRVSFLSFHVKIRALPLLSNVYRRCSASWVFRAVFTVIEVLRSSTKKREPSLLKEELRLRLGRGTILMETVSSSSSFEPILSIYR